MKIRYRILLLLVIFICSLTYFSKNYLTVQSFDITKDTTEMSDATLPNISMLINDEEVNLLYGYTSNLDEMQIRETITPLTSDQTFTLLITENESVVRRMKYEIYDVQTGNLFESGTISALSIEDNRKTAKIKIQNPMTEGAEYAVRITLITNTSKRIYYYTRLKMYSGGYLTEKLDYVEWFHNSALLKENEELIQKNLETKSNSDTSSFAKVDIYSNWDMVSWGTLAPTVVYEMVPTITDYYDGSASVVLNYIVSVQTGSGIEYYTVTENFRFLYTEIRTYLYNYERTMEALYDVDLTSLSAADLKIGITNDTNMEIFTSNNNKYISFVRSHELWSYDYAENTMTNVFSFREPGNYLLDLYDNSDIEILRMDDNGNIDFVAYGYMNRGEYEGRVGIVLYRYYKSEDRIEEKAYFPMSTTYQIMQAQKNSFIFMNEYDLLYITIYDTIYTYNLTTKEFSILEENVPEDNIIFSKTKEKAAWQQTEDDTKSKSILITNLEDGSKDAITVGEDEVIRVLGKIDENIIYGVAKTADIIKNADGTSTIPMYKVAIIDFDGNVLKEYEKEGIYITDASVSGNVITLNRVQKRNSLELSYETIDSEAILNRTTTTSTQVYLTTRVTDQCLTEYYISFPANYKIESIPTVAMTVNTVLEEDTTVRITESETRATQYMTCSFGKIMLVTTDASEAIRLADGDEGVGAVIESNGLIVWERGVKGKSRTISEITPYYSGTSMTSLQASIKMLLAYKSLDVDTSSFTFEEKSIGDWLKDYINITPVNLKGITMDEALYYIYQRRPVLAVINSTDTVLIYAYSSSEISFIDPDAGKARTLSLEEAEALFEESGNRFYSYIE